MDGITQTKQRIVEAQKPKQQETPPPLKQFPKTPQPPPEIRVLSPTPPQPDENTDLHLSDIHFWIPTSIYSQTLQRFPFFEELIDHWSWNRSLMTEGHETEHQWKAEMTCYNNDHAIDYIKSIGSLFPMIQEYTNM